MWSMWIDVGDDTELETCSLGYQVLNIKTTTQPVFSGPVCGFPVYQDTVGRRKREHVTASERASRMSLVCVSLSPAVPLWDFLNGQSHLVAEVSARVHNAERAFSQDHSLPVLVVLVVVLQGRGRMHSRVVVSVTRASSRINATAAVKWSEGVLCVDMWLI